MPIIVGVIVLVLAGLGFWAYQVYASPGRVWQKFISTPINTSQVIAHEDVNFTYKDNGELTQEQQKSIPYAGMLSKIQLIMGGSFYINGTNLQSPEMSGDVNYSFASGNSSFSTKLQLVLKDQSMYLKLGDIPFISGIISGLNSGEKVDWLKVNFKDLQEFVKSEGGTGTSMPDFAEQTKKYQDIMQKHESKIIVLDKVLGRETIHNVQTIHYSNKLDKVEAKAMINEIMDAAFSEIQQISTSTSATEIAQVKSAELSIFNGVIDRMEVKSFETWIGASDAKLYRIKFVGTAPSLVSMITTVSKMSEDGTDMNDPQTVIDQVMKKTLFDGQIDISEDVYDYGKTQAVVAPAGAMDLVQKLKDQKAEEEKFMNSSSTPTMYQGNSNYR